MAPLHSFLPCNHLSPLSPECTYRTSSGGRPHHSQRENEEMRGQKLRGLFQIDARLIEHRFVLPWGVSEICRAILYLEHLNLKDRQIPTDFYFLAAPKYNKLPRVSQFLISLSEQCFCKGYGAIVEALKCHTTEILLQKHPGVQCTLVNRLSKRWDRLPVWNWLLAGTAFCFQSQCSAIMWAQQPSSLLSLKFWSTFPSRLVLNRCGKQ